MKKLTSILIGVSLSVTGLSQSCLPEGITFTSQVQIDNFQVNYPGCTQIEGDLEIEGDDIQNLDGLSVVTAVGGQLYITNNDLLEDIAGLASLTSIGGSLLISSNPNLASLAGLENLSFVPADVFISSNPVLTDISAIGNIIAVNIAELWITNNATLTTCDNAFVCSYLANPNTTVSIKNNAPGCSNPPEVADDCGITLGCLPNGNYNFYTQADIDNFQTNYPGCIELTGEALINGSDIVSLYGLNTVTSVDGSLKVFNCTQLESLAGLDAITLINGPLTISGNSLLTNISTLYNLDTSALTFVGISNNALLSECDIKSVCDYLSGAFGATHCNITNNNDGCKTTDEILQACTVGVEETFMESESDIRISPNPASSYIIIETPDKTAKFQISIFNLDGQELLRQSVNAPVNKIDIDLLPPGMYFVRLERAGTIGVVKFVKAD